VPLCTKVINPVGMVALLGSETVAVNVSVPFTTTVGEAVVIAVVLGLPVTVSAIPEDVEPA
jgi:hypothetical protein